MCQAHYSLDCFCANFEGHLRSWEAFSWLLLPMPVLLLSDFWVEVLLLAQQLPVRVLVLPSHPCGGCHCQLCLCQGTLPHLVSLVRLFCQPLSSPGFPHPVSHRRQPGLCLSFLSVTTLSITSASPAPAQISVNLLPSPQPLDPLQKTWSWLEVVLISQLSGFPPRSPSLSHSSTQSCGNGFLRLPFPP